MFEEKLITTFLFMSVLFILLLLLYNWAKIERWWERKELEKIKKDLEMYDKLKKELKNGWGD